MITSTCTCARPQVRLRERESETSLFSYLLYGGSERFFASVYARNAVKHPRIRRVLVRQFFLFLRFSCEKSFFLVRSCDNPYFARTTPIVIFRRNHFSVSIISHQTRREHLSSLSDSDGREDLDGKYENKSGRAMGSVLSKLWERRAVINDVLKVEIVLEESRRTNFRLTDKQKREIRMKLAAGTSREAMLIQFPGEDIPRTVFNSPESRADMLKEVEKFCKERATQTPQTLIFTIY